MAAAVLPGALTAYLSAQSGGYFPGAPALVAAELLVLTAAYLALARRAFASVGPALLISAAALGAFAAWALASSGWSDSPARALPEYTRALCYLAALVLFGLMPYSARRIRWMVYGLALSIVAVCTVSFLSRTAPDLVSGMGRLESDRLSYPLDYWNALGLLAGLGIILSGHFACASREHWVVRVAGAAAVPLLTATLYYTFSRGAVWATVVGVGAYLVVARPRGLVSGALATVPPTALALITVNPAGAITAGPRLAPETLATAHRTALLVFACVVGAGLIRGCLLGLDTRLERLTFASRGRRRVLLALGAAVLALALGGSAALHVPTVVADKYRTFKSDDGATGASGSSRFLNSADNGRLEHWDVALRGFERDHLRGSGAGTYQVAWARERPTPVDAHDGHSLYLETLGELGVVGLGLLAVCLLLLLAGFARRARGPDRGLFAALLAAGLAWALVAVVDWVWEMPAVTLWLFALGGAALARTPREAVAGPGSGRRAYRHAGAAGWRRGRLPAAGGGACPPRRIPGARRTSHRRHARGRLHDGARGGPPLARARGAAGEPAPHHRLVPAARRASRGSRARALAGARAGSRQLGAARGRGRGACECAPRSPGGVQAGGGAEPALIHEVAVTVRRKAHESGRARARRTPAHDPAA